MVSKSTAVKENINQLNAIDYGKPDYVSYMFWFSQNGTCISIYVCSEYVLRWQINFILIRNASHILYIETRYYVIPFYDMDDRYVVDAGSSSWFEVHIIPGRSILI